MKKLNLFYVILLFAAAVLLIDIVYAIYVGVVTAKVIAGVGILPKSVGAFTLSVIVLSATALAATCGYSLTRFILSLLKKRKLKLSR